MSLIGAASGVVVDSIQARRDGDSIAICFDIRTVLLPRPRSEVRRVEHIAFVVAYDGVGIDVPDVYIDRADFAGANSLPHLNPSGFGELPRPCISRATPQALYDRAGALGLAERVYAWLNDAKADELCADGWEPIPVQPEFVIGYVDHEFLQREALAAWTARETTRLGACKLQWREDGRCPVVHFGHEAFSRERFPKLKPEYSWLPVGLVVGRQEHSGTAFGRCCTRSALGKMLDRLRVGIRLKDLVVQARANWRSDKPSKMPLLVAVALRRPLPILPDVFGLSAKPEERCFEVKLYLLGWESPRDPAVTVHEVRGLERCTPKLAAHISGVPGSHAGRGVGVIGLGALGSTVAEGLIRAGFTNITFVDGDWVSPHNVPRHMSMAWEVWDNKAEVAARHARFLGGPGESFVALAKSIDELDDEEWKTLAGKGAAIIDATAEDRVRWELSERSFPLPSQVLRTEIYHRGRLGLLSVGGRGGNPDLMELYTYFCTLGLVEPHIADWLAHDTEEGLEDVLLGLSCSSATFRMPNYKIQQHASAFAHHLFEAAQGKPVETGIGVNPLADTGHPLGWKWYGKGPFDRNGAAEDWRISIDNDVTKQIHQWALAGAPAESGGYLFGLVNVPRKRAIITKASNLSAQASSRSRSGISLPSLDSDPVWGMVRDRSAGRLTFVGSWHSHPQGTTQASAVDIGTLVAAQHVDQRIGVPTIMMISNGRSLSIQVASSR